MSLFVSDRVSITLSARAGEVTCSTLPRPFFSRTVGGLTWDSFAVRDHGEMWFLRSFLITGINFGSFPRCKKRVHL